MKFSAVDSLSKRKKSDLLVVPFVQNAKKKPEAAASASPLAKFWKTPIETGDFEGKDGEVLFVYLSGEPEQRLALLGLGDQKKVDTEKVRRAYGCLGHECQKRKIESANLVVPSVKDVGSDDILRGISEGLLLVNYSFELHKKDKEHKPAVLLKSVSLVGASKKDMAVVDKYAGVSEGVYLARDLVNGNADDVTPQHLADTAKKLAKKFPKVSTTVFNKSRIIKEKMELLLAVNRGSDVEPAFIIMEYKGNPKSKEQTTIIGKGITYDTGGLNLKPTGYMETMKCDMSGAAAVLGTIHAAATIGLKVNLVGIIPTTENSIGARSYKPGDIYSSYDGKTVEIVNTDAEGRLILADALSYASKKLKPKQMIDLATLTGAIVVALGEETTGLMSNNEKLSHALIEAGKSSFERVWPLPLYDEYREQLKSDLADLKNCGTRAGGSITAAMFLKEFVNDVPWAHLDIAGTAFLSKSRNYHPKNATGVGVRLLIDFLEKNG